MNVYAGPPRAITRVTLKLVPLTPIHIGDGTEWRPDEYFIDTPDAGPPYDEFGEEIEEAQTTAPAMLCRFDQQAAMRAMTAAQRNSFTNSDLIEAAEVLREAGRNHVLDRIPLSAASASDLRKAMNDPLRGGAVKPFIRSGGRPYIPGSSIKGAFRTALASAALPREQRKPDQWTHKDALEAAFGLKEGRTETDPLRFLFVSDAELPEGATLIDKAEVVKPGGAQASGPKGRGGIQMHYEVTKSLSSSGEEPAFSVTVAIDERANQAGTIARPQARFDPSQILRVARDFHMNLFNVETERFFKKSTKALLLQGIRGHVGPAKEPPISQDGWNNRFLLLRLGRFGHFESKSLEGVRRGHFPQARDRAKKIRQPGEWGTTRTVTRDGNNNPIPFGWVIGWVVKEERLPC